MHELFIVKKGNAYVVRPAQIGVARGEKFLLSNLTGQVAHAFLPEHRGDVVKLGSYGSRDLPHCVEITVSATAPVGFSPIAVYVAEGRDFCAGESAPGIIISK